MSCPRAARAMITRCLDVQKAPCGGNLVCCGLGEFSGPRCVAPARHSQPWRARKPLCGCPARRQLVVVVAINIVVAIVITRLLHSKLRSCGALSRVKIMEIVFASKTLSFGFCGSGFRGCRRTHSHSVGLGGGCGVGRTQLSRERLPWSLARACRCWASVWS